MTLAAAAALALVVLVLAFTPGPVIVATVARALASGFAPALGFVLGVATVDLGYLLLAVYGLSAIAEVLGELFIVVKVAGAAYLLYLGVRRWRM
jgi:threonine/homoserine/homoserine lactone efflux protein